MVSTLVFVVLVSSQTAHWNMHCCRSLHTDISNLTWRVLYQRHGTQMRCCASLVLNIDHFLSIEPKYKIPVSWQYYWGHLHIFIHKMINFPTDTINFTSAMFIWMEAWSLAPMILLLAELQKRTKYITFTFLWVTSYTLTSKRIVMTNTAFNWAWRTNYASFQLITKVYFPKNDQDDSSAISVYGSSLTIYVGRTGPQIHQRRSAWLKLYRWSLTKLKKIN